MNWPKLVVFVRHGESEGNVLSADERAEAPVATHAFPLTSRGRRQVEMTRDYLKERYPEGFDVRYVSYYVRAKETMEILSPGERAYEDPRLAEAQRGIWHTITRAQIERHYPFEIKRKEQEGLYHYRAPGGENWADVELRGHSMMGTVKRDYSGKSLLVVVHAHWLILLQRLIHHFSIEEAIRRYHQGQFENASVTVYNGEDVDGQSRLVLKDQNIVPWEGKL